MQNPPRRISYGTTVFHYRLNQFCGSGMIYSESGFRFEFPEFRIRIQPILGNFEILQNYRTP